MKKSNIYTSGNRRKINPNWFTGRVHMKEISSTIKSKEQNIYHVYFEDGARTKLHLHNGSQILIATKGNGSLEIFKKSGRANFHFKIRKSESVRLNPGDMAYIPKNTLHTHGSINPRQTFSHIAINILPRKNADYKTTWYESDSKSVSGTVE
jgi:quercetin dioxygenase-like cupin family protein